MLWIVIPCVYLGQWISFSSQDHIGLESVVSEMNYQCLFHLRFWWVGEVTREELVNGNLVFSEFQHHTECTTVHILDTEFCVCPSIAEQSFEDKYTRSVVYFALA